MKNILLASTALVMTAGFASAEVALSGYAEMGIKGGDATVVTSGVNAGDVINTGETQFHNDIDIKFSLSGETDGGLAFGATIDLDEVTKSAEVGGTGTLNRSSVFISGAFGKVTMGDTDGAFDWAMKELEFGTSMGDDHTTHQGFNLNSGLDGTHDGQIVRYEYSFGAISAAVSAELDDAANGDDPVLGLAVQYKGDMAGMALTAGAAYQTVETAGGVQTSVAGVSVFAGMDNGLTIGVNLSQEQMDGAEDINFAAIGAGYTVGALSLGANYGVYTQDGAADVDGFGLVANYDLGGGAVVMAGYGSDVSAVAGDQDQWSIGLGLSF